MRCLENSQQLNKESSSGKRADWPNWVSIAYISLQSPLQQSPLEIHDRIITFEMRLRFGDLGHTAISFN